MLRIVGFSRRSWSCNNARRQVTCSMHLKAKGAECIGAQACSHSRQTSSKRNGCLRRRPNLGACSSFAVVEACVTRWKNSFMHAVASNVLP